MKYFAVPGEPKFISLGGSVGPSEVKREGDEVRQKLVHGFARGRPTGSGQKNRWYAKRDRLYGNPHGLII